MDEAARADRVLVIDDGELLLDGTPREVFSQVELLERVGLEAPQATRLLYELTEAGLSLPLGCIGTEECAEALLGLWKAGNDGTVKA